MAPQILVDGDLTAAENNKLNTSETEGWTVQGVQAHSEPYLFVFLLCAFSVWATKSFAWRVSLTLVALKRLEIGDYSWGTCMIMADK